MDLAKTDILDQLTTAVMALDPSLRVCYLNPAAEALLGTSVARSAGHPVGDVIHPDDPLLLARMEEVLMSGQSMTRRAASLRTRDGSEVTADLTVSREPATLHLIVEMQPINRLVRINRDDHSVFSQETSRLLVRGLAHEIKNPLGGVRGAAQLLERELDDDGLKEYTRVIIDEADRLKELVDRMLGPNVEPQKRPVNVHEVIEHVVRLIDAENSGAIAFGRDYDPSLPPVLGDESQLIQALLNILANAAQALEGTPRPTISLRTRVVRRFTIGTRTHRLVMQIDIVDNGPGIAPDMLDRIYFPMISGRPEGTGLGLAITQTIIGQHGGIIECESRPGRTCFSVFLPLEEKAGE
jgi:two-component system, NtrC family, nitrogen regulation sensor histidine kinase GlnL